MGVGDFVRDLLSPGGPDTVAQTREHNCVPTVLAMIFEESIETVEAALGSRGPIRVGDISQFLVELGGHPRIVHGGVAGEYWSVFRRDYGGAELRALGAFRPESDDAPLHAVLVTAGSIYDPKTEVRRPTTERHLKELDFLMLLRPAFLESTDLSEHAGASASEASNERETGNGVQAHWRKRVMEEISQERTPATGL